MNPAEGGGGELESAAAPFEPIQDYQDRYPFGDHGSKSITMRSDDERFELGIGGFMQARFIGSYRRDEPRVSNISARDENEYGFEFPRVELGFSGHVERVQYALVLAKDNTRNDEGDVIAQDLKLAMKVAGDVSVSVGRYLLPFLREDLAGAQGALAAELSYASHIVGLGRGEGVSLTYSGPDTRAQVFLSDGISSGDPTVDARFFRDEVDFAFTLRADRRLAGSWSRFSNLSAAPTDEVHAFLGAAIHYQSEETGDAIDSPDRTAWTIDGSAAWSGWTAFGSVAGIHVERGSRIPFDDYAAVLQLGHRAEGSRLEPFARFETIAFEENRDLVSDRVSILTTGLTVHVNDGVRWVFDASYAFDPIPFTLLDVGLLEDAENDGQVALRAQLQLRF